MYFNVKYVTFWEIKKEKRQSIIKRNEIDKIKKVVVKMRHLQICVRNSLTILSSLQKARVLKS